MSHVIADILRQRAQSHPSGIALTCDGQDLTWLQLLQRACKAANYLRSAGVEPQDRVAFVDKNGLQFFEFLFGCALCAAVPVPVSWRFTAAEMRATISDAQVRLVLVGDEFTKIFEAPAPEGEWPRCVALGRHATLESWPDLLARQPGTDPQTACPADAAVMQLYTSGTTGLPKGVLIDARNMQCLFDQVRGEWDVREQDASLVCMPLFHMGGVGWALAGMASGCRSVVVREFVPAAVLDLLQSQQVTVAFFVPAMLSFLCAIPGASGREYSLRRIVYSGSPITQETLRQAMATFSCEFVQIYGMSETTGSFAQLSAADHETSGADARLLRSAGKPYPWVEVRIVDMHGDAACARGEVGEICTRSAQNTPGYWRNAQETAKLLAGDGWLRTGDAGYQDEAGYIFLTDRVKDMIISGGENVFPAEVENALSSHPAVAEVAVIGVPSEKWGETVKAVVALKPGARASDEELIGFARSRLATYKCPTSIDTVPALPRSATGKVLKKDLREPYWRGRERRIN